MTVSGWPKIVFRPWAHSMAPVFRSQFQTAERGTSPALRNSSTRAAANSSARLAACLSLRSAFWASRRGKRLPVVLTAG
ncbi:MAG: hypothetical protein NDJ94_20565 [Vicinamibacteria bacterium]|nr:hypothetical protein [Vicinamibacteria bacterium]